jgi:hypothetical protein
VLEVFGEVDRGHAPAPELALDPKAVGERRGKALRHSRQEYPAAGFERFHVVKTIPGSTDRGLGGAGLAPARLAGDLARTPALRSLAAGLHIESQARPPQDCGWACRSGGRSIDVILEARHVATIPSGNWPEEINHA